MSKRYNRLFSRRHSAGVKLATVEVNGSPSVPPMASRDDIGGVDLCSAVSSMEEKRLTFDDDDDDDDDGDDKQVGEL